ncbi:MAG: hypothetical protein ABFR50_03360 [Candidatus Fermentibacteria bacterium]
MKPVTTTLMLILLLAGCSEKERYAERYLDSIGLILHTNRPAEVSGHLRDGVSPCHTVEYPDLSGISRLSFTCNSEDTAELLEQLSPAVIPCEVFSAECGSYNSVEYWQEGITWEPEYHWRVNNDSCFFTATVIVSNSTDREWFSQRTVMKDSLGNPLCMVSDTLIIRTGDMELGWWNASGDALPLTLSYGWPVNSQWSQLVPCIVPHAGDLIRNTGEWPLRTHDTLWVKPETEIEITETIHQNTIGYDCTLQIYNQTDIYTEIRIAHPDRTPRGALFQPQGNFPPFLGLQPGDVVILEYRILYN